MLQSRDLSFFTTGLHELWSSILLRVRPQQPQDRLADELEGWDVSDLHRFEFNVFVAIDGDPQFNCASVQLDDLLARATVDTGLIDRLQPARTRCTTSVTQGAVSAPGNPGHIGHDSRDHKGRSWRDHPPLC